VFFVFVFKAGIQSLSTCLPVDIEIVAPFNTTEQPSFSHQALQQCFRNMQSQCLRVDTWISDSVLGSSDVGHVFEPWSNLTKYYKISMCCLSTKHVA